MTRAREKSVLRYWLSLLRHEEALAARPRARRVQHGGAPTGAQLAQPAPGQDYMKLPLSGVETFLVRAKGEVEVPVVGEAAAFFEDWLAGQYRRGIDEGTLEHLVFFPSLLLPRQELAGPLRFAVVLEWLYDDGKRFVVPSARERARKHFPPPPGRLRIQSVSGSVDDSLPFFVDSRLLRDTLRIDAERLDEFFAHVRQETPEAREVVARLNGLLFDQVVEGGKEDAPAPSAGSADERSLLSELCELTRLRLAQCQSKSRVFDVAVLLDASRDRATFHVQRDLQAALSLLEEDELDSGTPLRTYLGEQKSLSGRAPVLGSYGGIGLTPSQRAAGELFLGSTFAAVQGPPGTGKTHLLLTLGVSELVRKVEPLLRTNHPSLDFLLATSTNNRAVDNVVEPLGRFLPEDRLPLSLRIGSREVVEKVSCVELARARRWIERHTEPSEEEWEAKKHTFGTVYERVVQATAPALAAQTAEHRLAAIRAELTRLDEQAESERPITKGAFTSLAAQPDLSRMGLVRAQLEALSTRLRALSDLSGSEKTTPSMLTQHYKLTTERFLAPLESNLGSALQLALPPKDVPRDDKPAQLEAWENAAEESLANVLELLAAVEVRVEERDCLARRTELEAEAARLEKQVRSSTVAEVDWHLLDDDLVALSDAALELRECWARKHRAALLAALGAAIEVSKRARSLRALLAAKKGPGIWLRRLYPVWGCTLLSLGNNFNPAPAQLSRVVIDEAGQCHAAYAASAMLRAASILVIGDTHQLEPVVEVSKRDEARVVRGLRLGDEAQLGPFRMHEGCENSAQSLADRAVFERPTLIDHFRCQPEIAAICERLCGYGLVTHTPPASCATLLSELSRPLLHVPVSGQQERFAGSWMNRGELELVQLWVQRLLRAGIGPAEIGIITPFRGQLEALWRQLRAAKVPLERPASEESDQVSLLDACDQGVALGTVHRFQGGERRVILFSTTLTHPGSLRFVDARVNLINVAASRAREHLLTIGHTETLAAGVHTRLLLDGALRLS